MVDDDEVAELAHLRRRAYGPDADIAADPAAVVRLDELETLVRRRFAAVPDAATPERVATTAVPDAATAASASALGIPGPRAVDDLREPTASFRSDDLPSAGRFERSAPPEPRFSDRGVAGETDVEDADGADVAEGTEAAGPRRHRVRTALVAVAAVGAVVLAAQFADRAGAPSTEPTPSPSSASNRLSAAVPASNSLETRLVDIPLDRSLSRYVRQTLPPAFPVAGGLSWAETLGPYYGWNLWLARSSAGDQRCILVERGDKAYAQCLPEEGFLMGELEVSVPFGDVAPEYRPARMTGGESLIYRWTADRGVAIVLDPGNITYFGDDD